MHRLATLSLLVLTSSALARDVKTIKIWPGKAPGEKGDVPAETREVKESPRKVTLIRNVSEPTLTFYPAPRGKATGAAMLVCPGGGYNVLAADLEGSEVAEWLNSIGVHAYVLHYRVPRRKEQPYHVAPLQDAQRALGLLRAGAKENGIDPARIGILGFSAGGNLSALAATNFDKRAYETVDDADKASCRPDFAVLVYPAYLATKEGTLAPEVRVSKETPPCFFVHASDDKGVPPENSLAMYLALKKVSVAGEVHIYTTGGHGFGLRPSDHPISTWPARCEAWLRAQGFLKK
jgi:acetyl esterase/lipase